MLPKAAKKEEVVEYDDEEEYDAEEEVEEGQREIYGLHSELKLKTLPNKKAKRRFRKKL